MKHSAHGPRVRWASTPAVALLAFLFASCTTSDPDPGPAADLSVELSGGNGVFLGDVATLPSSYEEHEFVASGTATDYVANDYLGDDGLWVLTPDTTAAYSTRVLVRRPTSAAAASGTVIVEWLNVSGGVDAAPDFGTLAEEIVRQGHIWVGVSAQKIGVEGGPVLVTTGIANDAVGKGLKGIDATRYGSLVHPGDGYSFDIFTQVARALRRGGPVLGGVTPRAIIAAGESQSAIALTTYYDGVQPLTHAFDGFFIHSRGAMSLPLVGPGESADLAGALFGTSHPVFRGDVSAPVMDLQSEGDTVGLLRSSLVRQPDTDTFRLWEAAGTAHADLHMLGANASAIDCGGAINDGPMHVIAKAAFRALDAWVRNGTLPVVAPRLDIDLTGTSPVIVRDADGIALGGIRTPPVDVPVDVLSGQPAGSSILCVLLGSTTPLSDMRIAELYTNRAAYVSAFEASADASITAGFVLADDRDALLAYEKPLRVLP